MKVATLITEYRETNVMRGSRFLFALLFWKTKALSFLQHRSRFLNALIHRVVSVLPRPQFVIKNASGTFRVQPFDDSLAICSSYFEVDIRPWLAVPPQKGVFVDIGANRGLHTVLALRTHGYTAVHSFEPNPHMSEVLRENCVLNEVTDRVTIHPYALGAAPGTATFTVDPMHGGGGHIATKKSTDTKTTTVEVITLDTALADVAPETISFMKIDTEGYEWEVLAGGIQTLAKLSPGTCLMIECTDFSRLEALLSDYGFVHRESRAHDHLFQKHA